MISEQKFELPFDRGLGHGLLTYAKRLLWWSEVVLWNFTVFLFLYLIANWNTISKRNARIMGFLFLASLLLAYFTVKYWKYSTSQLSNYQMTVLSRLSPYRHYYLLRRAVSNITAAFETRESRMGLGAIYYL